MNRFDQLIDQWDERLRKAFTDAVYQIRNAAQIDTIAKMLERGDIDAALRAVGIDPLSFRELERAMEAAFEAGGGDTAKRIPAFRDPSGVRTVFQFAIRNPVAEAWLRNHSATLIREIVDDQIAMIRNVLARGMRQGLNPRSVALDIVGRIDGATKTRQGGLIGLTSSQEEWVRRYAEDLASDNPLDALSRTLRDKRFDAMVRKYAALGEPIPADKIEKMVAAYRNRALRYRAEAIARTEAMRALHQSQDEAIKQAIEKGILKADAVGFVWRTARDARVRDSHKSMEGETVAYGQRFTSGSGAKLRYPGDPNAPASETVNCRCWREPSIDYLAGVT